jgi:hypothetical protein
VTTVIFVLIAQQVPGCVGFWTKSSPVTPLPKNSVMISNATLNPVAVYECAAPDPSKRTDYVVGALAYEGAWRCMFFDPSSPSNMSSVGPGQYQVSECCRDVGAWSKQPRVLGWVTRSDERFWRTESDRPLMVSSSQRVQVAAG